MVYVMAYNKRCVWENKRFSVSLEVQFDEVSALWYFDHVS